MITNTRLASILFGVSLVTLPATAMAEQSGGHGSAEDFAMICRATGGTWVPQPADSPITACCASDGCVICDANGNNCDLDPPYSVQGSSAQLVAPATPDQGLLAPLQRLGVGALRTAPAVNN